MKDNLIYFFSIKIFDLSYFEIYQIYLYLSNSYLLRDKWNWWLLLQPAWFFFSIHQHCLLKEYKPMFSHYPIRKNSNGVKSGDLANHEVRPSQPIQRPGNEVMRQSLTTRAQWGGVYSIWTLLTIWLVNDLQINVRFSLICN